MSKSGVLELIDAEIERLTEARQILAGNDGFARGRGIGHARSFSAGKKRRHMSAEARRRISEAQKKRWAAVKRAAKK